MIIETDFKYLQSIANFASTDEARYVLNGVCVEIDKGALNIIATDGRCLGAYRDVAAKIIGASEGHCEVIPLHLIRMLAGVNVPGLIDEEDFDEEDFEDKATIKIGKKNIWISTPWRGEIAAKRIDGHFPKWKDVMPRGANEPIRNPVNAGLLRKFCDATEMLCNDYNSHHVHVSSTGESKAPYFIQLGHKIPFAGVLCVLDGPLDFNIPGWAK